MSIALEANNGAAVVQICYDAIVEASLHSRVVWEAFTNHPDVVRMHETLLLTDARAPVREHIKLKIISICGGHLPSTCPLSTFEIVAQYWGIVSRILPTVIQHPEQSVQLFDLAEYVFRTDDEHRRNEESLRSYLTCWSTLLLGYRHREIVGGSEADQVVYGFTKLLRCCITSLKSFKKPLNACSLMTSIFDKFVFVRRYVYHSSSLSLFGVPAPSSGRRTCNLSKSPSLTTCSSSDSENLEGEEDAGKVIQLPILDTWTRRELYDLLLALADDRSTCNTLLQLTGEAEKQDGGKLLPIPVDRRMEIRSPTGYVGLQNPRAICYMNSLLTQLFMNLNFRQFMLGLEVQEAGGSQHLLSETQKLFAEMQTSYRRAADPRPFAACVKNLDKTPIDIGVQMDADEFYNLLFDQWEAQLVKEEDKQKFRAFYGGQTLQQVKSKECEHVSERAETFFALQCDVQGKANLRESLQSFVQGDVMEGDNKYKCESCGGKFVDAVKR
jgi:ubiquitin carboxyl-terminal hydrolase 34